MHPDRTELVSECIFCGNALDPDGAVVAFTIGGPGDRYLIMRCHLRCLSDGLRDSERAALASRIEALNETGESGG